jgi:protein TonB
VEKPLEQVQPKQKTPERRKIVKPAKTREPIPTPPTPPQQDAVPEAAPAAGVVEARAGVAVGTMNGDNQGVIGGVAGGHAGGIIGGHGTEPLPVNQVANPPLLLARVTPEYPRAARVQGIEGLVLLEAILNLDGQIEEDIKVLQSIPVLDQSAIRALRYWHFRPARDHEGRPVRVILEVPIRFVLK